MSATEGTVGFRHFHEELDTLKQRLLDMSGKAEALLDLAIDALLKRDEGLAEAVLKADHEIDRLEVNPNATVDLDQPSRGNLIQALLGLTVTEMENVLAKCAVRLESRLHSTSRISAGSRQLLVGPASSSRSEQMNVRSSTRATSPGSERAR